MTPKTRGRKTILDAKLQKQICDLLSDGVPIGATCDCVGISPRTYHGWIGKGEADPASAYAHFLHATVRARGQARAVLVRKIKASDDWRALAWLLSHVWPDEFSESRAQDGLQPPSQAAPTTVVVNVKRDSDSDAAVKLFGKRSG